MQHSHLDLMSTGALSNAGRTHSFGLVGVKFYRVMLAGVNMILSMHLQGSAPSKIFIMLRVLFFFRSRLQVVNHSFRNQCSVFRPWQGWTSMSTTRQNEGTLQVLPMLSLATAYLILRPFFRPRHSSSNSLRVEDWEIDLSNPLFPGSGMGKGQELNEITHPHLQLYKTMVAIPKVEPGDQIYCTFLIH